MSSRWSLQRSHVSCSTIGYPTQYSRYTLRWDANTLAVSRFQGSFRAAIDCFRIHPFGTETNCPSGDNDDDIHREQGYEQRINRPAVSRNSLSRPLVLRTSVTLYQKLYRMICWFLPVNNVWRCNVFLGGYFLLTASLHYHWPTRHLWFAWRSLLLSVHESQISTLYVWMVSLRQKQQYPSSHHSGMYHYFGCQQIVL